MWLGVSVSRSCSSSCNTCLFEEGDFILRVKIKGKRRNKRNLENQSIYAQKKKNNSWHFIYETHKIEVKKKRKNHRQKKNGNEKKNKNKGENDVFTFETVPKAMSLKKTDWLNLYYTFLAYFRSAVITHSPFKIEIKIFLSFSFFFFYIHIYFFTM